MPGRGGGVAPCLQAPRQKIDDPEELAEFRLQRRKVRHMKQARDVIRVRVRGRCACVWKISLCIGTAMASSGFCRWISRCRGGIRVAGAKLLHAQLLED